MESPVDRLGMLLQDDYSVALYGAPARVDQVMEAHPPHAKLDGRAARCLRGFAVAAESRVGVAGELMHKDKGTTPFDPRGVAVHAIPDLDAAACDVREPTVRLLPRLTRGRATRLTAITGLRLAAKHAKPLIRSCA